MLIVLQKGDGKVGEVRDATVQTEEDGAPNPDGRLESVPNASKHRWALLSKGLT